MGQYGWVKSIYSPEIPLKKGDFEQLLVPPFLMGARGDRASLNLIGIWVGSLFTVHFFVTNINLKNLIKF